MKRILVVIILTCSFVFVAKSQNLLSVQEAVEITLENNYSIKLSQSNLRIASENVTYGNAGILPTVTGNFTQSNSVQNSTQTQNTGTTRSLDNAKNNNMNYGVSVGWTIFDGFGMFKRYETFQELEKSSQVQLQKEILTQVSDVITLYYTIVEQTNILHALDSSVLISKERLQNAENRYAIGKASKLEVLNVQVNLNTDESTQIKQKEVVKNLKISLNNLLGRSLELDFKVVQEVSIDENLNLNQLLEKAQTQNPDLLAITIAKRLAELELQTLKSERYPTVRLNGGYNFSESESSLGFVSQSSSRGLTYGITASVNIFDGFNQRRKERIAKIQIDRAQISALQQIQAIESALMQAFESYQTNLALAKLESNNLQIAKENLEITMDKHRIGSISTVEFRDAQENYMNAITRFNSSKLRAKFSETQLKEIVGSITL